MKAKNIKLIFLAAVISALAPVYADDGKESADSADSALTQCEEPRRMVCPRDYRPVCGQKKDGKKHTFPNNCTACSDNTVVAYREGVCE